MVYFKKIYKFVCFAGEGGPKFSEGPIVNSYGNLQKTCNFPWGGGAVRTPCLSMDMCMLLL